MATTIKDRASSIRVTDANGVNGITKPYDVKVIGSNALNIISAFEIYPVNRDDVTFPLSTDIDDLALKIMSYNESANVPYLAKVSRGLIDGETNFSFSSVNNTVGTVEETIWDHTGRYVFLTADTQLYISSTSASDTTQLVVVNGINNAGALVTISAIIGGQTQVALSGLIENVFNATVISSTEPVGDFYIAETDTLTAGVPDTETKVKGKIIQGNNTTDNGIRVVPVGHTLEVPAVKFSSGKNDDFTFFIRATPLGNVPLRTAETKGYQSFIHSPIPIYAILPARTRLEMTAVSATGSKACTVVVDAILREV